MLSALRIGAGLSALLAFAGCAQMSGGGLPFRELPFASGTSVSVVTAQPSQLPGGEMGALALDSRGNDADRTGAATRQRALLVGSDGAATAQGIERDLVYNLMPGGGGFVSRNGVATAPLAWK